jgi:hypothetical protein
MNWILIFCTLWCLYQSNISKRNTTVLPHTCIHLLESVAIQSPFYQSYVTCKSSTIFYSCGLCNLNHNSEMLGMCTNLCKKWIQHYNGFKKPCVHEENFKDLFWAKAPNSVEQSSSWRANCHSASQKIRCLVWDMKVYYRVHKSLALVTVVSQMNWSPKTPCCGVKGLINMGLYIGTKIRFLKVSREVDITSSYYNGLAFNW